MSRAIRRQAITGLDPAFLDELWAFISAYVTRSREAFERALRDYEFVTTWRDRQTGELVAFSANKIIPLNVEGRDVSVIYSGWAVLSPAVRGRNLIQGEGLRCTLIAKHRRPLTPAYWVFGASTYKSYLLMPRNFATYYPTRHQPWPALEQAIRDGLMAHMADPNWDAERGVIHRHGVSRYLEGVVQDEAEALRDPDIAFYAACNPGQAEGDTLLSVVPLSAHNMVHMVRRGVQRALGRRS